MSALAKRVHKRLDDLERAAKLVKKWRREANDFPVELNNFKAITLCYCAEQLESALNGTPPKP